MQPPPPPPFPPYPLSAPHPPQTHILPADVVRLWSHTSKPPLPDLLHTLTPTLKRPRMYSVENIKLLQIRADHLS